MCGSAFFSDLSCLFPLCISSVSVCIDKTWQKSNLDKTVQSSSNILSVCHFYPMLKFLNWNYRNSPKPKIRSNPTQSKKIKWEEQSGGNFVILEMVQEFVADFAPDWRGAAELRCRLFRWMPWLLFLPIGWCYRRGRGVGDSVRSGERIGCSDAGDPKPHSLYSLQVRTSGHDQFLPVAARGSFLPHKQLARGKERGKCVPQNNPTWCILIVAFT